MTRNELMSFLDQHRNIEWHEDAGQQHFLFRNTDLNWYLQDEHRATAVKWWKIDQLTPEELLQEINRGLMVEGITRITGYFTKITSWNPGKLGELRDRRRCSV
jgi:hypothetical protein